MLHPGRCLPHLKGFDFGLGGGDTGQRDDDCTGEEPEGVSAGDVVEVEKAISPSLKPCSLGYACRYVKHFIRSFIVKGQFRDWKGY